MDARAQARASELEDAESARPAIGVDVGLRPLSAASFVSSYDRFLAPPLLAAIAVDFGVGLGTIALVASINYFVYGLAQLGWGIAADRFGRIAVVRFALFGCIIAAAVSAASPTLGVLLVGRALAGAMGAAIIPAALVHIGDATPLGRRAAAFDRIIGAIALGTAAATVFAGVTAQLLSWRVAFASTGVLAALLIAPVSAIRGDERDARSVRSAIGAVGTVLRSGWARLVIGLVTLEGGIVLGGVTFFPLRLKALGYSASTAGLVVAVYGIATWAWTRLVRRVGADMPHWARMLLGASSTCSGFAIAALVPSAAAVVGACILVGAGYAFMHPTMQTWATDVVPQERAAAVSLFVAMMFVGSAITTQIAGRAVAAGHFAAVFMVLSALAVPLGAGAACGRWLYGRRRGARAARSIEPTVP